MLLPDQQVLAEAFVGFTQCVYSVQHHTMSRAFTVTVRGCAQL